MPIYEYECTDPECGWRYDYYAHTWRNAQKKPKCDVCGKPAKKLMSTFVTSDTITKPLSGVDDTDDFTIGKLVANRRVPNEIKNPIRERIQKFNERNKEYTRRQEQLKFQANAPTRKRNRKTT